MSDMVNNLIENTINILVQSKAMYIAILGLLYWIAKTIDYEKLEHTAFKIALVLALLYLTYKIDKDLQANCNLGCCLTKKEVETRVETLGETLVETHCNPDGTCTIYKEEIPKEDSSTIEDNTKDSLEEDTATTNNSNPIEEQVNNE
jgi:hypothetical protein